ncbi:MAG: membrane protein FxsA, partial [Chitinivibrionales bacterium]|nr:membrane protein FxsA [Chitinivibrionales bacterium]MBD3395987.1 membrane protein FxsA [Chitinivibrionales bacterium]
RRQGLRTMERIRASLARGNMPADDLINAVLIFIAGIVLITPGFLTDSVGFLLLIPYTRDLFRRWLKNRFRHWIDRGDTEIHLF